MDSVPFNVQNINGSIFVTYAPVGHAAQTGAALGQGAVAVFSESGVLQQVLTGAGHLAAPWGITLAPAGFGQFGGDLLVGNFSYINTGISAFDPVTGAFLGTIPIDAGIGNSAGGLWALGFGIGGSNGDPNTLDFTDGIDGENTRAVWRHISCSGTSHLGHDADRFRWPGLRVPAITTQGVVRLNRAAAMTQQYRSLRRADWAVRPH